MGTSRTTGRSVLELLAALALALAPGSCSPEDGAGPGTAAGDAAGEDASAGPRLLAVAPTSGSARGGDAVTITGRGFTQGSTAWFGDTLAGTEVLDHKTLRAVTPPLLAGRVDLRVEVPGEESAVLEDAFEVFPLELRFVDVPGWSFPGYPELDGRAAAAADVDGDGDPDLALFPGGGTPMLLRNDGAGGFLPEPLFPAGPLPSLRPQVDATDLAALDIDGDGAPDLVATLSGIATPLLLRNDGAGAFRVAEEGTLPGEPGDFRRVAAADLDGDGTLDLALAEGRGEASAGARNRLLLQDGNGSFEALAPTLLPDHGEETVALVPVDVDQDGDPDLVLGNRAAADGVTLRLLLQVDGAFHDAAGGMLPGPDGAVTDVVAGDLDRDGDPDLVAICPGAQDRLYINDGWGFFFDATPLGMPVDLSDGVRAALGDLDRDGVPDLVVGNDPQQDRLYLNDGRGRFLDRTPLLPMALDSTRHVLLLDVDLDADLDLLFFHGTGEANRLLLSVKPEVSPWR